jgi:hypothetical protein
MGDVPQATYFFVDDLFPYHEAELGTAISLPDLLARYGAQEFSQVALESLDGVFVTLDRQYVTERSRLVPYMEGIRFKDENQHASTWLKRGCAGPLSWARRRRCRSAARPPPWAASSWPTA